jgi:hypothetical protein
VKTQVARTSTPTGIILILVLEGLTVLLSLLGIAIGLLGFVASTLQPAHPVATVIGFVDSLWSVLALGLSAFALYGLGRRRGLARTVVMVQAGLNSLLSLLIPVGILVLTSSTMPSPDDRRFAESIGETWGILTVLALIALTLSILILWYMTRQQVKEYLSE